MMYTQIFKNSIYFPGERFTSFLDFLLSYLEKCKRISTSQWSWNFIKDNHAMFTDGFAKMQCFISHYVSIQHAKR